MLKKLPPKEIISEKYMPDADAPMKLVYTILYSAPTGISGGTTSVLSLPKQEIMNFKHMPRTLISWII